MDKYPARALREALVNAFAHRDYQSVDPLRVTAFRSRIEISSPGDLASGLGADDLAAATAGPRWRNQSLAWFLARLGLAEAEGQGLRTIQAALLASGCPRAEFETGQGRVLCRLRAHPRTAAVR